MINATFAHGASAIGYNVHPAAARQAVMRGTAGTCVVRLVDRRTGLTQRVGGRPQVIFSRYPQEAAAELLEGRDRSIWEVRIDPIEP